VPAGGQTCKETIRYATYTLFFVISFDARYVYAAQTPSGR